MSLKSLKTAKSLGELAIACRKVAKSIDKDVNRIAQNASKILAFRLIYETPVDTSQALSNWQVSFVFPGTSRLAAYSEGEHGSTKTASAARAYAVALARISKKKPRIPIIIHNNLSYIHKLNAGGSKQQSAYYIEKIVAQVNNDAQKALKGFLNGD